MDDAECSVCGNNPGWLVSAGGVLLCTECRTVLLESARNNPTKMVGTSPVTKKPGEIVDLTEENNDDDEEGTDDYDQTNFDDYGSESFWMQEEAADKELQQQRERRYRALVTDTLVRLDDGRSEYLAAVVSRIETTVMARPLAKRTTAFSEWSAEVLNEYSLMFFDGDNLPGAEVRLVEHSVTLYDNSPELRAILTVLDATRGFELRVDFNDDQPVLASHPGDGTRLIIGDNTLSTFVNRLQTHQRPQMALLTPETDQQVQLHQLRVFTSDASVWRDTVRELKKQRVFKVIVTEFEDGSTSVDQVVPPIQPPFMISTSVSAIAIDVRRDDGTYERIDFTIVKRSDDPTLGGGGAFAYETDPMHIWMWYDAVDKMLRIVHFHVPINSPRVSFVVHEITEEENRSGQTRTLTERDIEEVGRRVRREQRLEDGFLAIVYNGRLRRVFYLVPGDPDAMPDTRVIEHMLPGIGLLITAREGETLRVGRIVHLPAGINPRTNELAEDVHCTGEVLDLCPRLGVVSSKDLPALIGVRWMASQFRNKIDLVVGAAAESSSSPARIDCVSACSVEPIGYDNPLRATVMAMLDAEAARLTKAHLDEAERLYEKINTLVRNPRYQPSRDDFDSVRRAFGLLDSASESIGKMERANEELRTRSEQIRQSLERVQRALANVQRMAAPKRPAELPTTGSPKRTGSDITLRGATIVLSGHKMDCHSFGV